MEFGPHIENGKVSSRKCNCGEDHEIEIINGMFHYAEENHVAFSVALVEHASERHVWISLIAGEWPGTDHENCYVTSHIWTNDEGRVMEIVDSSSSPFEEGEVFDCYPVTRDRVIAQEGAKDWFIRTYLALFEHDNEIGGYLEHHA